MCSGRRLVKNAVYAIALWLLCGVIGEMLIRSGGFHLDQIALGPITLGKGISHFLHG